MSGHAESRTSASLLGRLRQHPADQQAWGEFVARYGPKIYSWCRHWQLQEADAEDVTQIVLVKLAAKMRTFAYDPGRSFRAWLKTVAHHAWRDFLDSRASPGVVGNGDTVHDALASLAARDDLLREMDALFEREVLEEAMARVQLRVAPHTWEAFRLLTFEGLSGAEAAPRVGMQVAMVFVAKSKVQKMLRQEVKKLDRVDAADEEPGA
jgi:RNA polymerase sigma factor (sigma-70 family)